MPGLLPQHRPRWSARVLGRLHRPRAQPHVQALPGRDDRHLAPCSSGVYGAHSAVLVPGSGTFGMESVARQFAQGKHVMVIRNGWFSYRWTQIFDMGSIPASHTVMKARRIEDGAASRLGARAD